MRTPVYSVLAAALVAGASGAAAAAGSGMPQLNFHDFAPQLVWLAITFVVLYLVMSKLAVPLISDTLDKRQAKIQGDLDAAEKASEDTRALVAAYEKRLADAREEARRLQRERNEADSAAATARLTELADRLNARIDEAEKRIAGQRAQVMEGLEDMAHDIAADVYSKLSGQPADAGCAAGQGRRRQRRPLMFGTAWAADKAAQNAVEGKDAGFLHDPTTWVAVAFVLFFVLLGKILLTKVTELLDKRSAAIAKSLSDAERLRAEAIAAKTAAEKTLAQATAEAEGIIAQARDEVARMQARAATSLQNAIALREQQALDRIAQSEAAASKQVRDTAVDVALGATRALLREQVGSGKSQDLVDQAITELPRRLH